jgi:hypothetical protein
MVVADNEVSNDGVGGVAAGAAVCARTAGVRLTSPTAAKPNVHLFIFMFLLLCYRLIHCAFLCVPWGENNSTPHTKNGALVRTIEKSGGFDNKFFRLFIYKRHLLYASYLTKVSCNVFIYAKFLQKKFFTLLCLKPRPNSQYHNIKYINT